MLDPDAHVCPLAIIEPCDPKKTHFASIHPDVRTLVKPSQH